jgi:hypothetical protein
LGKKGVYTSYTWDLHPEERRLTESIYTAPSGKTFNVRGANNMYRAEH